MTAVLASTLTDLDGNRIASQQEAPRNTPFRIQFFTNVVAPLSLPGFPYVASKIEFAGVLFTTIVYGATPDDACTRITDKWPEAQIRYVEQGASAFRKTDTLESANVFGSVDTTTEGVIARFSRAIRGH